MTYCASAKMVTSARMPCAAMMSSMSRNCCAVIRPAGHGHARAVGETHRRNFQPVPVHHHAEDAHVVESFRREKGEVAVQPRAVVFRPAQRLEIRRAKTKERAALSRSEFPFTRTRIRAAGRRRVVSTPNVRPLALHGPHAIRIAEPHEQIISLCQVRQRAGPREIAAGNHVARIPRDGRVRIIHAIDAHLIARMRTPVHSRNTTGVWTRRLRPARSPAGAPGRRGSANPTPSRC